MLIKSCLTISQAKRPDPLAKNQKNAHNFKRSDAIVPIFEHDLDFIPTDIMIKFDKNLIKTV